MMKETYFLSRTDAEGNERRMPIGIIKGATPGERITVFGGQHGTEYAGIEAAMRLFRETDPADVSTVIKDQPSLMSSSISESQSLSLPSQGSGAFG